MVEIDDGYFAVCGSNSYGSVLVVNYNAKTFNIYEASKNFYYSKMIKVFNLWYWCVYYNGQLRLYEWHKDGKYFNTGYNYEKTINYSVEPNSYYFISDSEMLLSGNSGAGYLIKTTFTPKASGDGFESCTTAQIKYNSNYIYGVYKDGVYLKSGTDIYYEPFSNYQNIDITSTKKFTNISEDMYYCSTTGFNMCIAGNRYSSKIYTDNKIVTIRPSGYIYYVSLLDNLIVDAKNRVDIIDLIDYSITDSSILMEDGKEIKLYIGNNITIASSSKFYINDVLVDTVLQNNKYYSLVLRTSLNK